MKDNEHWREKLTPEEFEVCREKGCLLYTSDAADDASSV